MGRRSLAAGRYFRLLLMGYFGGIDVEGMAWRAADSLALRSFLGVGLDEMPPDHSTIDPKARLHAAQLR
jgi:transposase